MMQCTVEAILFSVAPTDIRQANSRVHHVALPPGICACHLFMREHCTCVSQSNDQHVRHSEIKGLQ